MKKIVSVVAVIAVLALVGFGAWYFMNSPTAYSGTSESITIGYSPFESVALLWVAVDQNFFSHNGLNVTSRKYDTGVGALDGLLNDEVDIVVGANEFPWSEVRYRKKELAQLEASLRVSSYILLAAKTGELRMFQTSWGKGLGRPLER